MKQKLVACFILSLFVPFAHLNAQAICENDIIYFPENHPVTYEQVVYKNARQINELIFPVINENLALRVYYPSDLLPGEKRPLITLVHGGGFIGGNYSDFFEFAEELASLGYIAASIQYRLCKRNDCLLALNLGIPCNVSWGNSMVPSAYVAAVDVADGIRWLQDNSEDYFIDPENIIVGGYSAGAITALNVAFSSKEEFNQICAGCGNGSTYLTEALTPPDGIKGVISLAGAMFNIDWIDDDENDIAVIMVHGTSDGAVSYQEAPVYPCCGTYSHLIAGSCKITGHLHAQGNSYYLMTAKGYGHDLTLNTLFETAIEQITGAVAQVVNCNLPFQKHAIIQHPNPVLACPPPITNIPESELCNFTASNLLQIEYSSPVNTGIALQSDFNIQLYPNPAGDVILVEIKDVHDRAQDYVIFIYDAFGQLVHSGSIGHVNTASLDLSDFPAGIYALVVECREKSKRSVSRFVKL
jgi:predicted esterase